MGPPPTYPPIVPQGLKNLKKIKNTSVLSTFLLKPLTPELKRLKIPVFKHF